MKLRNPFSDKTRALFMYCYECWVCGRNQSLEINHIFGRMSDSPLNASVLCRDCHSTVGHSWEEERNLLRKTILFLRAQGYKLTKEDELFLESVGNRLIGFTV